LLLTGGDKDTVDAFASSSNSLSPPVRPSGNSPICYNNPMFKDKWLVSGIVATIILIAGGVFLMTRGNSGSPSAEMPISSNILVPEEANITSGIENGKYLPASPSAKLTLVEFGDYECPACAEYNPLVKQLLTEFSGKINYVFRSFPLSQHSNAWISSQAAEAAGLQGKYWQMHDKLYESMNDWSASPDAKSIFVGYAQDLDLNVDKFKVDIDSKSVKDKIQKDANDGNLVKLTETPTFYLNGVKIGNLTGNYEDLKKTVSGQL
jgi:protein-disulfide isomerase